MVNTRSETLVAVCINIMTLLDVTPCNLVHVHQHFGTSPAGVIFSDAFIAVAYIASDGKMINELDRICKEVVVA
jgi:hypothetical protein